MPDVDESETVKYFDTGGVRHSISDIDMGYLRINLDQFLWVPSIAEISPKIFEDN